MSKGYTKEEFSKKWPIDEIPDCIRECAVAWAKPFNLFIEDTIRLARDMLEATEMHKKEYSKSKAIDFADWLFETHWRKHPDEENLWYLPSDDFDIPPEEKSSNELYAIFIQQY